MRHGFYYIIEVIVNYLRTNKHIALVFTFPRIYPLDKDIGIGSKSKHLLISVRFELNILRSVSALRTQDVVAALRNQEWD